MMASSSVGKSEMEVHRQQSIRPGAQQDDEESTMKRSPPSNDQNPPSKKAKRVSTKKVDKRVMHVRRTIQQCCATDDLATAMEAYDQAVDEGIRIEAQSFYNLLNLCGGLSDRGVHVGTPKPTTTKQDKNDDESDFTEKASTTTNTGIQTAPKEVPASVRKEYAFRIKQRMDEQNLPLNETAYSALIRLLSREDVHRAAELLQEAEVVSQCKPRLRLYSSLLCAYCESGDMVSALKVWSRLAKRDLSLTEKEYAAFLHCAVKTKDALVFERVLSELAEDVLVPSKETLRAITDWFESSGAVNDTDSDAAMKARLDTAIHGVPLPTTDAPSMGPVVCSPDKKWIVSRDCSVDCTTGVLQSGCLQGETLQPITLSPTTWNAMKQMNETIVLHGMLENDTSKYQGGGKGPKRESKNKERKTQNWKAFQDYLEQRAGPIDVVIDGANVGYYKQNFAQAPKHVDYRQIDWVVQQFSNKSVLLILHERHFAPNLMPSWAAPIVSKWSDILYKANYNMNDDWFWMHAALSNPGALVLTNDEMRDHHFQLLHARSFERWKERHQVKFGFGDWDGESRRQRTVVLSYPDPYSRRIQRLLPAGLVVPLPKRGDERRFLDGSHVADDDEPQEETYVCIRMVERA